jgi:hypothetical protein
LLKACTEHGRSESAVQLHLRVAEPMIVTSRRSLCAIILALHNSARNDQLDPQTWNLVTYRYIFWSQTKGLKQLNEKYCLNYNSGICPLANILRIDHFDVFRNHQEFMWIKIISAGMKKIIIS